jgi:hypothetical protein
MIPGWVPYGPKGFTRPILELLAGRLERRDGGVYTGVLASGELLRAAELLPPANLEDRQNCAPSLRDFLSVARAEPRALFEVYVVPDEREDERLTVEGVYVPSDRPDLIGYLYRQGAQPDREEVVVVGGVVYHHMWWD